MIFKHESDVLEVYSFIFILGAVFGSFLNVLILRLPLEQSLLTSSSCPHCKTKIPWFYNIPIISFFILKAKCSFCHEKISYQYIVVETLTALLTLMLFFKLGWSIDFVMVTLLFYTLIVLAFIDLKYKAVPDYLLLIGFVLVFTATELPMIEALKNAALFAGAFALLEFVMTFYIQNIKYYFTKDESLKEAQSLGEGDIPIVAIIGALLGVASGLTAIFLAALFAIIPSLYNSIKKQESQTPFIPYLLLGLGVEYLFSFSKVFN